jgi:hypothetical protein
MRSNTTKHQASSATFAAMPEELPTGNTETPASPNVQLATQPIAAKPASLDTDPSDAWAMLHGRLCIALAGNTEGADLQQRLNFIADGIAQLSAKRADDSLFVLVQMLFDNRSNYSATHALLCALICQMMCEPAGIADDDQIALVRAALTMNIGMTQLHDQLSRQAQSPSSDQKQDIQSHPIKGAEILRERGVQDPILLSLVEDHHEDPSGVGYPRGKTDLTPAQQLLHLVDLFAAHISPRKSRRSLAPNAAVADMYLKSQNKESPLGAIFARKMGMYPPGTYVELKNKEIAVVVRRGERVHMPVVMAIADAQGMPLSTPSRRNTELAAFAVQSPVATEDVKISVDVYRMLKRV